MPTSQQNLPAETNVESHPVTVEEGEKRLVCRSVVSLFNIYLGKNFFSFFLIFLFHFHIFSLSNKKKVAFLTIFDHKFVYIDSGKIVQLLCKMCEV